MTERDANNRRIAEWLEPMPTAWTGHILDVKPSVWIPVYSARGNYWKAPDFYTDESANAMLLDAMNTVRQGKGIACSVHLEGESINVYVDQYSYWRLSRVGHGFSSDRKTAIASAFIAWKEKS